MKTVKKERTPAQIASLDKAIVRALELRMERNRIRELNNIDDETEATPVANDNEPETKTVAEPDTEIETIKPVSEPKTTKRQSQPKHKAAPKPKPEKEIVREVVKSYEDDGMQAPKFFRLMSKTNYILFDED